MIRRVINSPLSPLYDPDMNAIILGREDGVKLMTLHASRGLEFPIVFLTRMIEGIFPHIKSMSSYDDIEEERRLCYMAITRAKTALYLTYPRTVNRFVREPSRFIYEITGS